MTTPMRGGSYVLMNGAPRIGADGLTVSVRFAPAQPRTGVPQGVLAHAQDGAGWWVGIAADGRAVVGVGTASGPVSLPVGSPLDAGAWVQVIARIPGLPGQRLEIELVRGDGGTVRAGAVLGSGLVTAPGSAIWGARALRDRRVPEHPFVGVVAEVAMVADRTAVDLASHDALLGRWDAAVRIDATEFGDDAPVLF